MIQIQQSGKTLDIQEQGAVHAPDPARSLESDQRARHQDHRSQIY